MQGGITVASGALTLNGCLGVSNDERPAQRFRQARTLYNGPIVLASASLRASIRTPVRLDARRGRRHGRVQPEFRRGRQHDGFRRHRHFDRRCHPGRLGRLDARSGERHLRPGPTNVNSGTLMVGNGVYRPALTRSTPGSTITVASGATLEFNNANTTTTVTMANPIAGAGTVLLQGFNNNGGGRRSQLCTRCPGTTPVSRARGGSITRNFYNNTSSAGWARGRSTFRSAAG